MAVSLSTAAASTRRSGRVFAASVRPGWDANPWPSSAACPQGCACVISGTLPTLWNALVLMASGEHHASAAQDSCSATKKRGRDTRYDAGAFRWSALQLANAISRRLNDWSSLSRDKVLSLLYNFRWPQSRQSRDRWQLIPRTQHGRTLPK